MKKIITTILLITSISCSSIPEQNNNAIYIQNVDTEILNHDNEPHNCSDIEGTDYYYEVCLSYIEY